MAGPKKILTGPQALGIGVLALAGWTCRASLRTAIHVIRFGPDLLGFLDDDFDDEIAEQRERLDALARSTDPQHHPTTEE